MKKNLKIIFMLLKMKLSKMMVFRFDFFGAFFVDSSLFILQLLMFNSIYSHVDSIGGMATRRDVNIYRNFLINKCDKYDDFLFWYL